ncbi:MAG TPA: response regulator [Chitinophagaceae bacterium]|nr:response regulator [Chitinophagaceae bacterium]
MKIKHSILYAEDDFEDYYLLRTAFEDRRPDVDLVHKDDGWEVLEYLQNLKLPTLFPSLIILDINMNGIGGKETLQILRSTKRYAAIPVVMFSSSRHEADQAFCRMHGIDIIRKPSTFDEWRTIAGDLAELCDRKQAEVQDAAQRFGLF